MSFNTAKGRKGTLISAKMSSSFFCTLQNLHATNLKNIETACKTYTRMCETEALKSRPAVTSEQVNTLVEVVTTCWTGVCDPALAVIWHNVSVRMWGIDTETGHL